MRALPERRPSGCFSSNLYMRDVPLLVVPRVLVWPVDIWHTLEFDLIFRHVQR
jgi:hypothetical protein